MKSAITSGRGDANPLSRGTVPELTQQSTSQPVFNHFPLDYETPSIRLIKIQPELSFEGYIQCDIQHSSINSTYACLSYVWGGTARGRWISLNQQSFWLRENLWQFLSIARQKPEIRNEWLWIDALCIDQSNNSERTHQVQQMGRIYSNAIRVISWLGIRQDVADYFASVNASVHWAHMAYELMKCDYWERAWITQELALARSITYLASDVAIDGEKLGLENRLLFNSREELVVSSLTAHSLIGKSLVYLLEAFYDKTSSVPRDRIFSLLSLCGEGQEVKADYEIADLDLLGQVLRACKSTFCVCAVTIVERIFGIGARRTAISDPSTSADRPFAHFTLPVSMAHENKTEGSIHFIRHDIEQTMPPTAVAPFITTAELNCHDICFSSHYHATFLLDSSNQNVTFRCAKGQIKRAHGCTVALCEDAKTCTITLSLEWLLEISSLIGMALRPRCCNRVKDTGNSHTSFLRFCPE